MTTLQPVDFNPFVGLPWKDRGRDPITGVDCWGLVRYVYKTIPNIDLPDYSDLYDTSANREVVRRLIDKGWADWTPVNDMEVRPLDLIIMAKGGDECHVGIAVGDGYVLHIERDETSTIVSYHGWRLRAAVRGFARFNGLT